MRALVIDDSRAMRSLLSHMFTGFGFEIVEAGDGLEALQRLQDGGSFDIALVDWNMPHMNGFEFVKAVRNQDIYRSLKLMMVTTEVEMSQVIKAIEAGAHEYVMKPFTKEIMADKLKMLGFLQGE